MFGSKDYIGIALDNKTLDTVRIRQTGKKFQISDLVHHELIIPLDEGFDTAAKQAGETDDDPTDDIFGLEEETGQEDSAESEIEELDLDDFDELDELEDMDVGDEEEIDLVDEADQPSTNEMLLYNYLTNLNSGKKVHVGLNIRSGNTVYQFARDSNYSNVKKKELQELVENKLHSVYGEIPHKDRYSYFVRDDGTLSIASIDREPASLNLINEIDEKYSGINVYVQDILPDEVALTGLYRYNYPDVDETSVTGLIQFGVSRCRIIFMRGQDVLQVSPVINEGTGNKNFLNTLFSKMLFQLDTGEVPTLNRIILCDNTMGSEAVEFFQSNFPEMDVEEFQLNPELFVASDPDLPKLKEFTTAIAIAVGASGVAEDLYPKLSIIPSYVEDRQKIFKLEWHGVMLLVAIGLSPILVNHYYQQNVSEIERLESENLRLSAMITDIQPTVDQTEMLEVQLAQYQEQLILLNELSEGNIRWTVSFDEFNRAVSEVGDLWVTTFREESNGIQVGGLSRFESRIPELARKFDNVTLMNVRKQTVRDQDLFSFTMRIHRVVADETLYTPEETRRIIEFLESMN